MNRHRISSKENLSSLGNTFAGVARMVSPDKAADLKAAAPVKHVAIIEVAFTTTLPFKGGITLIRPGQAPWAAWKAFSDSRAREVVVDIPNATGPETKRYRIPFENVKYYQTEATAPV